MIFLVILVLSVLLALVRGGSFRNLAALNMRRRGIIILGFLIQVLIFSSVWQSRSDTLPLTNIAHLVSLGLLVVGLIVNRHLPGMWVIGLGFFLNLSAIALNGGYMPAAPTALEFAGLPVLKPGEIWHNSIGMGPDTQVTWLGDIFGIPKGFFIRDVFSVGDILIVTGAFYLLQVAMLRRPPAAPR